MVFFSFLFYLCLNFLFVSSGCKEIGASVTDFNLVLHYQQVQLISMLGTCSCSWYHSHQLLQHLALRQKVWNKGRLLIRFRFLYPIILIILLNILNQVDFDLTNIDPELVHTMWSLALESLNEVFPLNIVFVLSTWQYDDQ